MDGILGDSSGLMNPMLGILGDSLRNDAQMGQPSEEQGRTEEQGRRNSESPSTSQSYYNPYSTNQYSPLLAPSSRPINTSLPSFGAPSSSKSNFSGKGYRSGGYINYGDGDGQADDI